MTPFDAAACLAMLVAFYPIVGPGALLRARSERPEYFAGGTIGGREGDKLTLPDGRVFDCIFQVNTPQQHWQMLLLSAEGGSGGEIDPFALEDGPLVPIDESALELAPLGPVFEDFVTGRAGELAPHLARIGFAHRDAALLPPREQLAAAFGEIDDVAGGSDEAGGALDHVRPWELLGTTDAHAGAAGFERDTYTEPPPDDPGAELPPLPPSGPEIQEP